MQTHHNRYIHRHPPGSAVRAAMWVSYSWVRALQASSTSIQNQHSFSKGARGPI